MKLPFSGPNSVSIFAANPANTGTFLAFLLNNTPIPVPGRVRLDLTTNFTISRSVTPARSPVEPLTTQKIRIDPEVIVVQGSLSATPLGFIGEALGTGGQFVRRDLMELQKLKRIQQTGDPVHIVLPNREVFLNMSMRVEESHGQGNKVDLQLTFERIRVVSPVSLEGLAGVENLSVGAVAQQNVGSTTASAVSVPAGVG